MNYLLVGKNKRTNRKVLLRTLLPFLYSSWKPPSKRQHLLLNHTPLCSIQTKAKNHSSRKTTPKPRTLSPSYTSTVQHRRGTSAPSSTSRKLSNFSTAKTLSCPQIAERRPKLLYVCFVSSSSFYWSRPPWSWSCNSLAHTFVFEIWIWILIQFYHLKVKPNKLLPKLN